MDFFFPHGDSMECTIASTQCVWVVMMMMVVGEVE